MLNTKVKGDKRLSLKQYLNLIEKYLRELIEEYKLKGEWKVQLTIEVNFISLKPGSDVLCTQEAIILK